MKLSVRKKWTFSQRYMREAVFFGIPMVCLELIGIPRAAWGRVLILALPATFVALLFTTIIEHLLVSAISKRNLP